MSTNTHGQPFDFPEDIAKDERSNIEYQPSTDQPFLCPFYSLNLESQSVIIKKSGGKYLSGNLSELIRL